MTSIKFQEDTVKKYLSILSNYGVQFIEIRALPSQNANKKICSKIFLTSDPEKVVGFISQKKLEFGTVYTTFNEFDPEGINKGESLRDSQITNIRFFYIDLDPKRATKTSSTDKEKELVYQLKDKIVDYLAEAGVKAMIQFDSGNGYGLFLPVQRGITSEVKELHKSFLKVLHKRFSNNNVHVDTSVFNPARIAKLLGTPAIKGENSEERPHRLSELLSVPSEVEDTPLSVFERIVEENQLMEIKKPAKQKKQKDYVVADARKWLNHYKLDFQETEGDTEGVTLLIFRSCPIRQHKNNQSGACLSVTKNNRIRFQCKHASDQHATITDFVKRYPIPDSSRIVNRFSEESVTEKALVDGHIFNYGVYELSNKGVSLLSQEGKKVKIADPFFISETTIIKETHDVYYELHFQFDGHWAEPQRISAAVLQYSRFKGLVSKGLSFNPKHEMEAIDYILMQRKTASKVYAHQSVGWVLEEQTPVYLLDESYSKQVLSKPSVIAAESPYDFSSKGEGKAFQQLLKNCDYSIGLSLAVAIGFTSFVFGHAKIAGTKEMTNFLISLTGLSGSGKTTMLYLIASFYGNPRTLIRTMNATSNAIIKLAADNNGVPLILDELGTTAIQDLTAIFYQLSSGQERLRLNTSMELRAQQTFSTVPLVSSEKRMKSLVGEQGGLYARYVELLDIQWTSTAKEADAIKQYATQNYGHVTKQLLNRLNETSEDFILQSLEEAITCLKEKVNDEHLDERILTNFAVIYTAGRVSNQLLDLGFSMDELESKLLEMYQDTVQEKKNAAIDYYSKTVEIILKNANHYMDAKNTAQKPSGTIWGKVSITADTIKVNTFSSVMEEQLKRAFNTNDISYIIKNLIKNGHIKAEQGRLTKRVRINKQSQTTIELILPLKYKDYFRLNANYLSAGVESSYFAEKNLVADNLNLDKED